MSLRDVMQGGDTFLIAGVDLSHVGPKFGHDMPASLILDKCERHDTMLLGFLCKRDVDGFWAESRRVEDKYNVCRFSALACLSEILPPCNGRLLNYEIFREEPTRSAVSFAASVFVK